MRKLVFICIYLSLTIPCAADVIYVDNDANGLSDGTSWPDAYTLLQDALDDAAYGDEIRVAEGTYYPTSDYGLGIGDRGKHFRMKNGVAIYGGFPTGGSDFENRDPDQYETILSGDIGVADDDSDNCYHVFNHPYGLALDPNDILDGFTITAGNADNLSGGGMFNYGSSPTVTNCTFVNNSAGFGGGGMANWDNSNPIVTGCTFINNSANGGGMLNYKSNPKVTNCAFNANSAGLGGGIWNNWNSAVITNCTFTGNSSDNGGGMYNNFSSPAVTNCIFTDNTANNYGGGIWNHRHCSPSLTNCSFDGNSAGEIGGGIYNYDDSSPTVTNCTFTRNSADNGGGMCNYYDSDPTLANCIFIGNSANDGGGMWNSRNSFPLLINCTLTGNSAENEGGGMWISWFSKPTLTNCILWDNTAVNGNEIALVADAYNASINIDYCNIQGGLAGIYDDGSGNTINWGAGNIDVDPLFASPNDGDLHLLGDSPCIDAGDPNYMLDIVDELHGISAGFIQLGKSDIDISTIVVHDRIGGIYEEGSDYVINIDQNMTSLILILAGGSNPGHLPNFNGYNPRMRFAVNYSYSIPVETDFDGNPRIIDGDGDGEQIVDMGAYEYFSVNTIPVADAGDDVELPSDANCVAVVILEGSASTDADGDELTYYWYYDDQLFAEDVTAEAELGLGAHEFTLIVNDGLEDSEPDEVVVTVVDRTGPDFGVVMNPSEIWPPNNEMVRVEPAFTVSDNCSDDVTIELVSITSDEGDQDDYLINDGVYLRAERSGEGEGRVYILTYRAVDETGNQTLVRASVFVPHDQGQHYRGNPADKNNDLFINYLDLAELRIQTEAGPLSGSDLLKALVLLAEHWLE